MATALLLDTSSLFFRAHHALPPMNTAAGEPTGALYGFSAMLLKLLRERKPSELAFARDVGAKTFRHDRYAEYKAGRAPMPDLLRPQWPRLDQLIDALGVPAHGAPGFEADDVLASAASKLAGHSEVEIVSGDRDLFQLVSPSVRVLFAGARGQKLQLIDVAAIEARYGVTPRSLPALFALVGEAADNLVGVAGIGVRTASKLVARCESVGRLFSELEQQGLSPRLVEALLEAKQRVLANEELARLSSAVSLSEPVASAITRAGLERLRALFVELEFKSLLPRIDALAEPR